MGIEKESQNVYIQAGHGSFNDHAIHILTKERGNKDEFEVDEGRNTPASAMEQAEKNEGLAFVAVRNDLAPNKLIEPTIKALQDFEVVEVLDAIRMKIEMSLLVREDSVTPVDTVASIQPALNQVGDWIQQNDISKTIEVPEGTSQAAFELSQELLPDNVGVIAPEWAASAYPGLNIAEKGIQDKREDGKNNYTHFALMKVRRREENITNEEARKELQVVVDQIRSQIEEAETFFQLAEQ